MAFNCGFTGVCIFITWQASIGYSDFLDGREFCETVGSSEASSSRNDCLQKKLCFAFRWESLLYHMATLKSWREKGRCM
jgi:hypothetical protein